MRHGAALMLYVTREMARALYRAEGPLKLFDVYQDLEADPIQIVVAAKFFQRIGVATFDGRTLHPSGDQRRILFAHRDKFFGRHENRKSLKRKVRAFEPYMPDLSLIDLDFFHNRLAKAGGSN